MKFTRGEFYLTWSDMSFYHIKLAYPNENWGEKHVMFKLGLYKFYLSVPLWKPKKVHDDVCSDAPEYGISYHNSVLWIHKGKYNAFTINMPWQLTLVRHDLLLPDGDVLWSNRYKNWKPIGTEYRWYEILDGHKSLPDTSPDYVKKHCVEHVDFEHHTRDGRTQTSTISLRGEEREWRMRWFTWLPFGGYIQRSVDCWSDVELGERAGEWKGGLMGWSCEWLRGEPMKAAFYRWYHKWDGR